VYASISAFGQEGPWRDRPGVDGVAQAMGGIMSVTGSEDGPPVKVGVPAADMAGGMYTVQAVLAALFSRERTGRGQRVDVSLLDSLLAYQVVPLSMFLASGQAPQRLGTAAPYSAPNEAFPTNDGHVMVAAYTEKRWPAFCRVLGCPNLAADPRFDTNEKRVRGRSELRGVLEPLFRARSTEDWLTLLDAADIICGPLLSYADLVLEDQVIRSGALATVRHPHMGDIRAPVFPGRFSQTPIDLSGPPPALPGEDSVAILGECGFDDREIRELLCTGVVTDSQQVMSRPAKGGGR
jgi:formyl-CoA transferase/CoA:oxalate CoA-transferase